MTEVMELETARLRLRQWRTADREPFAQLNADHRVMAFFPQPLTRESSDAMVDRMQALIAERGWGFWATEIRETREFIGFVGLHVPTAELPFMPCVEIGWRLAFPYWGAGYASEAAREALHAGFQSLALDEVVSYAAAINVRSRAVMQRLGMRLAPDTFEHPAVPAGSPLREHCLYRLTRAEWHAAAAS